MENNLIKCHKCKEEKLATLFHKNKSKKNGFADYCKDCKKEAARKEYTTHKKRYAEHRDNYRKLHPDSYRIGNNRRSKKIHKERVAFIQTFKNVPCQDCGNTYDPEVMDFDHIDGKIKNVSQMTTYSKERILQEIQKCDVICSNCHRLRTKIRRNLKHHS